MNYYIAKIREYYAGQTNLMGVSLVTDDNGFEPLEFEDLAAARGKMQELDSELYYTQCGEAGRPTYYIIDEDCRDWLESDDDSRYDWDTYDGRKGEDGSADTASDDYYRFACEEGERYVKAHAITDDYQTLCEYFGGSWPHNPVLVWNDASDITIMSDLLDTGKYRYKITNIDNDGACGWDFDEVMSPADIAECERYIIANCSNAESANPYYDGEEEA